MPDPLWLVLGTVSLAMIANLWARARGSRTKKIIWSAVLLVPALGPFFYFAQYSAPGEQEEGHRALENEDVADLTPAASNED